MLRRPLVLTLASRRPLLGMRTYRGHNRIEDMLTASEAWHSLVPERPLGSDAALQDAFAKLDLDGNGHLDARELKQALLCAASKTVTIEVDIDDRVDEMIGWADMSDDGVVTFEEYKKIILAGCATRDGGRVSVRKVSAVASAISSPRTAGASVNSTTSTRGPDGDTIYL